MTFLFELPAYPRRPFLFMERWGKYTERVPAVGYIAAETASRACTNVSKSEHKVCTKCAQSEQNQAKSEQKLTSVAVLMYGTMMPSAPWSRHCWMPSRSLMPTRTNALQPPATRREQPNHSKKRPGCDEKRPQK